MTKKMSVKKLLEKYDLYTKEIKEIDYHLNILQCNVENLIFKIAGLNNLSEVELAKKLFELILKCDANNPDYEYKIDEEMTRIGLKTDKFYGGHCTNKWDNGMFEDDGFGFGTEITSMYDDYIDSQDSTNRHR